MSYHTLIIVGRLGKEPELHYRERGKFITAFSVAASYTYIDSSGNSAQQATWFRVVTFGKTAENCHLYLHKGSRVLVEGNLVPDPETGNPQVFRSRDGMERCVYEVVAQTVRFLSSTDPKNTTEDTVAEQEAE